MKYQNILTGKIITTDGVVNDKFKTITIQFEDGKIQQISNSTFKKMFKPIDNE